MTLDKSAELFAILTPIIESTSVCGIKLNSNLGLHLPLINHQRPHTSPQSSWYYYLLLLVCVCVCLLLCISESCYFLMKCEHLQYSHCIIFPQHKVLVGTIHTQVDWQEDHISYVPMTRFHQIRHATEQISWMFYVINFEAHLLSMSVELSITVPFITFNSCI